jgi:uncharacterized protein YbjT (DUF2867 family)
VSEKVIAVVGATGAQGGGLARAILDDPAGGFAVRALTRDPASDGARALAERGAEVVRVDLDDEASVRAGFEGAYGAFCVTFFWNHFSPATELAQAATMARAAKATELKHVIWSTLEDTRHWVPVSDPRMPTLMERYKVPHFDAKGEANRFFTEAGVPVTLLQTSFYWENFIYFGMGPQRGEDGTLTLTLPLAYAKLPGIASEDIGRCAYGVLQAGEAMIGRTVSIAGGHVTGAEMAAGFARILGEEVRYQAVAPDVYRGFGFPGAEDLGNMFQFKAEFEADYCAARDLDVARALNPALQSFDAWLDAHRERLTGAPAAAPA